MTGAAANLNMPRSGCWLQATVLAGCRKRVLWPASSDSVASTGEEEVQAPDLRGGRVRPRERGGAGRLGDAESVAAGLVANGAYLRGGGESVTIPWGLSPC